MGGPEYALESARPHTQQAIPDSVNEEIVGYDSAAAPIEGLKTDITAKVLIIDSRRRALVLKRSFSDTHRPGGWDLPGGGQEDKDLKNPVHTAIREVIQETKLEVNAADLTEIYRSPEPELKPDAWLTRVLYETGIFTGQVQVSDEHVLHWWPRVELVPALLNHQFWSLAVQGYLDQTPLT